MKIQDVKQFYADFFADFDKERFDSLLQLRDRLAKELD